MYQVFVIRLNFLSGQKYQNLILLAKPDKKKTYVAKNQLTGVPSPFLSEMTKSTDYCLIDFVPQKNMIEQIYIYVYLYRYTHMFMKFELSKYEVYT